MKKTLAALALAGSIALVGSAPALAYTSSPPEILVEDAAVAPNEPFILSGGGMAPNEPVNVTVTPVDGTAPAAGSQVVAAKVNVFLAPQTFSTTADGEGRFSRAITISESGTYSITATGTVSGNTFGPVFVEVDPAFAEGGTPLAGTGSSAGGASLANTGSGLANTGADSGLVLWTVIGAGALAAGAMSVVVVRRRAKVEAAA